MINARLVVLLLALGVGTAHAQSGPYGPADPVAKDALRFDPRRPLAQELQTRVPDGFTVAAVGDLIISRPLAPAARRLPRFKAVIDRLQQANVAYGNMETSIFDGRSFTGAPYSWDGDWTNAALPAVAKDLRAMGFGIVSRANNHALDWGLEGMRETGHWLDDAGIVHAGVGETLGIARAPRYLETEHGRVALVSLASTFRPTTDAMAPEGAAPGRAGLSALHLRGVVQVPEAAMRSLAQVSCELHHKYCGEVPASIELFAVRYRLGPTFSYEQEMDAEDLAEIYRSIREARENADFVIVSIHSHECSVGCDDEDEPRGPGNFLKELAHGAIDSGADLFVATGNHNLGPIEIYRSPGRGDRPIFYGLGNFFWSDVQELLAHELFQGNSKLLGEAWAHPERATEYDLTAPLNKVSFAHEFTFQSVIAECRYDGNRLTRLELRPIEDGYGAKLTDSGIPQLVASDADAAAIIDQIVQQNARFGLPALQISHAKHVAIVRPAR